MKEPNIVAEGAEGVASCDTIPSENAKQYGVEIAHHVLAESASRQVRLYLERGRSYQDRCSAELLDLYKEGLRQMIGNLRDKSLLDDAGAEYQLRSVELILDEEGKALFEELCRKAETIYESPPEEQKLEIGEEMVTEYAEAMAKRN